MIILGLTGSIAMGKSEAARMLRRFGVPVFDSDHAVHRLLGPRGAAEEAVARAFPEAVRQDGIDRAALGARVFGDRRALERLEGIVHPMVQAEQRRFLEDASSAGAPLAVLDIPLLFETGAERRVDYVAVVSAPAAIQRKRALARPGMSEERLKAVLAGQMPDAEKRRRADFVLPTGGSKRELLHAIAKMLRDLRGRTGGAWPWPDACAPASGVS